MASGKGGPNLIDVFGDSAELVDRLRGPLRQALSGARCSCAVRVDAIGPMGEILVSITGSQGRMICAERTEELICGTCSARIQGEAIVRKREDEVGAAV